MTQKMLPRRVDGFGNIIVPDYPSVESLMKIGNPENTRHHEHLMDLIESAYDGKDDVEDMMYAMNDTHGGAWYDDLWSGIKDVGSFLWNNKDDIISVAKMVAPLVGGGMEFDDAYEDVVGGAVSRYAHTLSELKHFTFPALKAYIAKLNKHIKREKNIMPISEHKYIKNIRELKNSRLKQEKRSTKLFEKREKERKKYMKSHQPSLGLFLPRSSARNSGHISRIEANEINADLTKDNRDAVKKAKKALSADEYKQLVVEINEIHSQVETRMAFNKKVMEALIDLDIGSAPKPKAPSRRPSIAPVAAPVAAPVVVKAPSRRPSIAPVDVKPSKKPSMAGRTKSTVVNDLGKANKAALAAAESMLTPGELSNILRAINDAHAKTNNPLSFNKVVKQIILENGLSIGKLKGYKEPRRPKPSARDYEYDYTLADKDHSGIPLFHTGIISPSPPPPDSEIRATGRPRKTTRKKSTRKPTKKPTKKSRKVRLI